ncbi:hypothetical protein [Halosegnis marinus]|uniref:hypothetical protein n=1 Tax=Halosegnis marinus TaxID=3034023 RepID=UPI00361BCBFB
MEVTPALVAVQYWMYYAFDQFTVNFHWHDWELLQVFVDVGVERGGTPESASGGTASDPEPVLLSASSHSRKVPNNEFLDPGDGDTVAVLSEVGSHSSATTVNEEETTFQRTALADLTADVTNAAVSVADAVEALPLAYGLPRDEGGRLPFVMPELDGVPLYDHPDVSVPREAFVDESVTVRDLADLARPPGDLPTREHGTTFTFGESGTESEAAYALAEVADLTDIDRFVGPQLSFEFAIPGFVEDRFASHITTAGTPWDQPRFTDPVSDVTDGAHRAALADRYGLDIQRGLGARVFGAVEELAAGAEGTLRGPTAPTTPSARARPSPSPGRRARPSVCWRARTRRPCRRRTASSASSASRSASTASRRTPRATRPAPSGSPSRATPAPASRDGSRSSGARRRRACGCRRTRTSRGSAPPTTSPGRCSTLGRPSTATSRSTSTARAATRWRSRTRTAIWGPTASNPRATRR